MCKFSYHVAIFLLVAAFATAITHDDAAVPEDSFEEFAQEMSIDDDKDIVHEHARSKVTDMLQSGATVNGCKTMANDCIASIKSSTSSAQSTLAALPTGLSCEAQNNILVQTAKKTLDDAKAAKIAAKKACDIAKVAPVKFSDIFIVDMKEGDCGAFFNDAAYLSAKKAAGIACNKASAASGALIVAQKAYDDAVAASRAEVRNCACKIQKRFNVAWPAAQKTTAGFDAEWKKCHHMLCVLNGVAANKCSIPTQPTLTKPTLTHLVTSENCAGWKPGQAPTKPAATPKPKCCAMSRCGCNTGRCSKPTVAPCCPGHRANCAGWTKFRPELLVRVKTGTQKYAESGQTPGVQVFFTKGGTYNAKISLPGKGKSKTIKFHPPQDYGEVKSVRLLSKSTDGWLVSKLEVKSGTRAWKTLGCLPQWLDDRPYDTAPYSAPYKSYIDLHPGTHAGTCSAKWPTSWGRMTKGGCFCKLDSGLTSRMQRSRSVDKCGKHGYGYHWCMTRDDCVSKTGGKGTHGGGWDICIP